MKNFLLVYKSSERAALQLAREITAWLKARGHLASITQAGSPIKAPFPDVVIALGGDGTILGIARQLVGEQIPILGINFGRVGFLTAAEAEDWQNMLQRVLASDMPVNQCMAISWDLIRGKISIASGFSVNDVVLGRNSLARLGLFRIYIDNVSLGPIRSDGIIVYSPLGSTGYSSSANGPILQSQLNIIGVTPVCPFPRQISPLIFSGNTRIILINEANDAMLTIDGQDGYQVLPGDTIEITGVPRAVCLLITPDQSFSHLQRRLFREEQHLNNNRGMVVEEKNAKI